MQCDFCTGRIKATWSYPAKSFQVNDISWSSGAWAACDLCRELIEKGDRAGLAMRAAESWTPDLPHVPIENLIDMAQQMHSQFFAHRTGPAVPI